LLHLISIIELPIFSYEEGYYDCSDKLILTKLLTLLETTEKYTINWAASLVALTIMDLETITFLDKHETKPDKTFKNRVKQALKTCKPKNKLPQLLELVIEDDLWNLRNKIIHEGYVPTDEETYFILNQVEKYLTWLKKCKPKKIKI